MSESNGDYSSQSSEDDESHPSSIEEPSSSHNMVSSSGESMEQSQDVANETSSKPKFEQMASKNDVLKAPQEDAKNGERKIRFALGSESENVVSIEDVNVVQNSPEPLTAESKLDQQQRKKRLDANQMILRQLMDKEEEGAKIFENEEELIRQASHLSQSQQLRLEEIESGDRIQTDFKLVEESKRDVKEDKKVESIEKGSKQELSESSYEEFVRTKTEIKGKVKRLFYSRKWIKLLSNE
jgi:hypothetical protein